MSGISIGLSRLYAYLTSENVIMPKESTTAKVLVVPMVDNMEYVFKTASKIRDFEINTEVCYNRKTVKSMLNYANRLNIPYVVFIGEDEINNNTITIKDMESGNQETIKIEEIKKYIVK